MHASDVELALRIFRHIGDVSMVFALERLLPIEDKNLLAGQIAVLLGRFDQAEELLLRSSMPIEALNLRRDLLDWPVALSLAEKLSPEEIPCIAKEYAQQLEFIGDYSLALAHYEKGVVEADDMNEKIMEHNEVCRAGVARMSIRTGDIRRGIQLAREQEGRLIKRDCAIALEQLKQLGESAELYELGQYYDRAAAVCLKAKAWGKVAELLPKVRSPKIHAQFGRVMESEKKYQKAAVAYKAARDYDNLVRVLLDHLDQAEEAVKIVRESRSVEGAKLVAKFFSKLGDHSSAIQFLVISQCQMEAFQLAETNDRMLDYAVAIDEFGTPEQYAQLGEYFANSGDMVNSGKFFKKAGHFNAALNQLIQAGDLREAYSEGIDTVAKSGDPNLMKKFKDYLLGELDGIPKDAHHLFRFYVALKQTREAAKTAIIIAVDEQENGKYTKAREVLFFMYRELISQNIRVPMEMENSLMLIHSYLLVKVLMGMEQWMRAARLICRVVSNISRFPAHIVPILTSAVVICSKAGLHNAALQAATQLMNPSYRNKIDAKYKKKIESLVRKGDRKKDPEDLKSPCFFCQVLVTEMDLHCSSCKNNLPYCILTGRHITAGDFALCSQCDFPGYYSEFKKHNTCPMCNAPTKEVIPGSSQAYMSKLKHQTARD
ncbi:unnamed protein product [Auanema sp. JU1783]|nr:unnamed protein product [Auanema sp. JU1783]